MGTGCIYALLSLVFKHHVFQKRCVTIPINLLYSKLMSTPLIYILSFSSLCSQRRFNYVPIMQLNPTVSTSFAPASTAPAAASSISFSDPSYSSSSSTSALSPSSAKAELQKQTKVPFSEKPRIGGAPVVRGDGSVQYRPILPTVKRSPLRANATATAVNAANAATANSAINKPLQSQQSESQSMSGAIQQGKEKSYNSNDNSQ
jgi:hypothetical protein